MNNGNGFLSAYQKLNIKQKEAVDAIEGPVMVIAGPGTGKTQILTLRVANILAKTDTPADAILSLTFTEAAAANMRRRLVALIGSKGYYAQISTFHGFCNKLIQEYPDYFPAIVGAVHASDPEQIGLIRAIIEKNHFQNIKPFGDKFFYVTTLLASIRELKREGVSAEKFAEILKKEAAEFEATPDKIHIKGAHQGKMKGEYRDWQREIEKNRELLLVYQEYQKALAEKRLYDFEDMILETVRAMEADENFRLTLQERYQYILVDEHQDTNGAQNKVLEFLGSYYENPNLFVVGDEKQAIFRFQGASLENFLYFQKKYPKCRLISLEENYRSTQAILDSAQSVIENNKAKISSQLRSQKNYDGRKISITPFILPEAELTFLADTILEKIKMGEPAREIAVLYRENKDALALADFLEKTQVSFVVESNQNILEDLEIQKAILLLEAIQNYGNSEKLAAALHINFLGVHPLDVYALLERGRVENLFRLISHADSLSLLKLEKPEKLLALGENFRRWKEKSANLPFLEFFELVARESGFLAHLLSASDYLGKMEKLGTFYDEARKFAGNRGEYRLKDFLTHLEILREHKTPIKATVTPSINSVRLMTAHRAKGLEFNTVFLIGATDGHWGNKRSISQFKLPLETTVKAGELEKNEDERRLFYMALTRAREEVFISYALKSWEGREQVPSQFVGEIKPELKIELSGQPFEEKFLKNRAMLFAERQKPAADIREAEFVKELFLERGLSVSALNNYLTCPWRYFYQNLIRIPKEPSVQQRYGTAMHAALQKFFNARKAGQLAEENFLVERFWEALNSFPLAEIDKEAFRQKGEKTLRAYYQFYKDKWNYNTITEYRIPGVDLAEGVRLTGVFDKLELHPSTSSGYMQEVVVVDYKSKQPESRNAIEGKAASSDGNYKRQLVFYKLLLDADPQKKFKMASAVIDFLEPNERGIFKQEQFEILDTEVEELKKVILAAADEIVNLKFWDKQCGEKDCEFCKLREMMN